MAVSGVALFYTTAGAIIFWSGIKGQPVASIVRQAAGGKTPTGTNSQPINTDVGVLTADITSSGGPGDYAAGAPTSGNRLANMQALKRAAAKHGWDTGAEWTALNYVEMREAGYSLTAKNPTSNAYGMAQFINGPSEYYQYGGNPQTADGQATAMVEYIKQRYGTPSAAAAHERANNWY